MQEAKVLKTLKKSRNFWVGLIIVIFSSKLQMRWPWAENLKLLTLDLQD
jgi:hypothetical protein